MPLARPLGGCGAVPPLSQAAPAAPVVVRGASWPAGGTAAPSSSSRLPFLLAVAFASLHCVSLFTHAAAPAVDNFISTEYAPGYVVASYVIAVLGSGTALQVSRWKGDGVRARQQKEGTRAEKKRATDARVISVCGFHCCCFVRR
jgi:NO-binding membrane sensor protein with MHYT domain